MTANPIQAYGQWLAETPHAWPSEAIDSAHLRFIDTISVMLPGAREAVTRRVFETVAPWGAGPSAAVGMGARLASPWAAMVNGTAAHALDFDDNFDPAKAHASAVLVPTILAMADQQRASGAACLDAYVAGLQILGRVGQGVNPVHRNRGWHATATVGAIGAAAACARLLGLDAEKAGFALSIATSMAGGFMSQFGTMTKPIHAGLAAKAGVMAASLAASGIDAGLDTLDGRTGMNRLMVGPDYEALRDGLTHVEHGQTLRFETENIGEPLLILSSGLKVKRFPNCGSAHRAMDGLLALRAEHGFTADRVREIHVRAPATHLANLMYERPRDPLEAKFSMEYALAMLLLIGDCGVADFTDAQVGRADVQALYSHIHRHPVDKSEGEFPTEVEVVLEDGRSFITSVAMPAGSLAAPFAREQYWDKFDSCTAGLFGGKEGEKIREALQTLPGLASIESLTDALVVPVAAQ
jgi:2-methylcitrate dehydratase PrpD